MTIFFEESMPYAQTLLSELGEVESFKTGELRASDLKNATLLFVRSTTVVDKALLAQAKNLTLVGTATSGSDHVDEAFLREQSIPFVTAKGSNAQAVAEYVVSVLLNTAAAKGWNPSEREVGIVGAGCVGSALSQKCEALGIPHVLYDPPLQRMGDKREFVDFSRIMQCNTISLHVPLVRTQDDSTFHMFGERQLAQLTSEQLLINAARGEVVDNEALFNHFTRGKKLNVVLDVWENEPAIAHRLLPYVIYATPHIAGHSIEGKALGTFMMYQAACQVLNVAPNFDFSQLLPNYPVNTITLAHDQALDFNVIRKLTNSVYDVRDDDSAFRHALSRGASREGEDAEVIDAFRYYRKNYAIRREFSVQTVSASKSATTEALYNLGFTQG